MLLWRLKQRLDDLGGRPGRCIANGVACGPCLLISREGGSGGTEIARLAGQRLHWEVFNREVLDQIAELADVRTTLTVDVDKRILSKLENDWLQDLKPEAMADEAYLRFLRQVILTLGHHGDVILVGRGAQFLLPSECALRVRVVAPFDLRVQRVANHLQSTIMEAKAQVEKFDQERSNFVRHNFGSEAGSPLNYDLVVNTAEMRFEAAADVVVKALRNKLGLDGGCGMRT